MATSYVDVARANGTVEHVDDPTEATRALAFVEQGVNSPGQANPVPEYNAALYPRLQALRTYEKMMRNDAQVRATLRLLKINILGGDWYVEPAESGDDKQDKEVAEFIQYNFFDNMTVTWNSVLEHALTMLEFGYAVSEYVYEVKKWRPAKKNSNSRDMVLIRKIASRPAHTIAKFNYDAHGGPESVDHVIEDPNGNGTVRPRTVTIPIDQLLIFTYDQRGGNKEGLSLLRSAYQHWYYKMNLYKIDAIQKERHGIGVPEIELPPGYTDSDLKFAASLGKNLRTNERAYILKPAGWTVGFAKVEGQLTDALRSAEHHDMMIARNALAQFINATGVSSGSGAQGGRSNSAVGLDLLLKSLRLLANMVCDVFNSYCIPQLVDYNYEVIRYPKLRVRGIGESRDLQMLAAGLRNLISENAISVDDDLERYIRRVFDLPVGWDKKNARVNEQTLKPFTDPSGIPVPTARSGGGQQPPQQGQQPRASTRGPVQGNMNKGPSEA
jgi:hypothetical protein